MRKGVRTSHALSTLQRQRGILMGEVVELETIAAEKREQIGHLDTTLALLGAPSPNAIKPIKPYRRVLVFKHGTLATHVRGVLHRAGRPLTTREVVTEVLKEAGHSEQNMAILTDRIRCSLKYLERKYGEVARSGKKPETRWALVAR